MEAKPLYLVHFLNPGFQDGMGGGTRTKRVEKALNLFLSFTPHCKYRWLSDYYHVPSILLANIVGTPSKLPMYNGGSASILHRRQQSREHTEKQ